MMCQDILCLFFAVDGHYVFTLYLGKQVGHYWRQREVISKSIPLKDAKLAAC